MEISTAACCDQEKKKKRPLWDKSKSKQFQARQPNNELEEDIKPWEEWAKIRSGFTKSAGGRRHITHCRLIHYCFYKNIFHISFKVFIIIQAGSVTGDCQRSSASFLAGTYLVLHEEFSFMEKTFKAFSFFTDWVLNWRLESRLRQQEHLFYCSLRGRKWRQQQQCVASSSPVQSSWLWSVICLGR